MDAHIATSGDASAGPNSWLDDRLNSIASRFIRRMFWLTALTLVIQLGTIVLILKL